MQYAYRISSEEYDTRFYKWRKGAILKKGLAINGSSVNSAKPMAEKWLKQNGIL